MTRFPFPCQARFMLGSKDGPKTVPRRPKTSQDVPKTAQEAPKTARALGSFRRITTPSKWVGRRQVAFTSHSNAIFCQDAAKRPQKAPRGRQEANI